MCVFEEVRVPTKVHEHSVFRIFINTDNMVKIYETFFLKSLEFKLG